MCRHSFSHTHNSPPTYTHKQFSLSTQTLAYRLGITPSLLWDTLRSLSPLPLSSLALAVRNVIRGHPFDVHGTPYPVSFVQDVFKRLKDVCRSHAAGWILSNANGEGSEELEERLFGGNVSTMTGRVRGGVGFTQVCVCERDNVSVHM